MAAQAPVITPEERLRRLVGSQGSPDQSGNLRDRLLSGVDVATPEQASQYFSGDDFRWGETLQGEDSPTGRPTILINDLKFQQAGAEGYQDKMVLGESLHRLKNVDPQRYDRLKSAATNSPEYMDWARESYEQAKSTGETRPFDQWHDQSRFDQVIGGYLFAGDESLPTMREWSREDLPFGDEFRNELDSLEIALMGQQGISPEERLQRLVGGTDVDPLPPYPINSNMRGTDYFRMALSTFASMGGGVGWLGQKLGEKTGINFVEDSGIAIQEMTDAASEALINDRLSFIGLRSDGLSPAARRAMEVDFLGEGAWGDKWNKAKLLAVGSLPATAAGLGVGAFLTRGLALMGAGRVAPYIGYGLGEAGVAAPMNAAQVQAEIQRMTHDELMESNDYRSAYDAFANVPEAERRERAKGLVASAASSDTFAMTMLSTFALSAPAGGILSGFVPGRIAKTGRLGNVVRGGVTESVQEFFQSGTEAMSANQAMITAGFDRDLWDGALEQAVGGALSGAPLGASFGVMQAPAAKDESPPPPPPIPDTRVGPNGELISVEQEDPVSEPTLRFQFMKDKGGFARQAQVVPLTQERFIQYVRPLLVDGYADTLEEYQAKHPDSSHILIKRQSSRHEWQLEVGQRPGPADRIKPSGRHIRSVTSFESQEAQEWSTIRATHGQAVNPNQIKADDSILVAISKMGGLSRADAEEDGIDSAEFGRLGHGIRRVFTNAGLSLDELAERLSEQGYPVTDEEGLYDANILLERIFDELGGNEVRSPEGDEILAKRAEEEQAIEEIGADRKEDARLRAQPAEEREAVLAPEEDEDRLEAIGQEHFAASGYEGTREEAIEQGRQIVDLAGDPEATEAAPIAPPGDRWFADRGAIPGEPFALLDNEDDAQANAYLIERQDDQGNSRFEAIRPSGTSIGIWDTVADAAQAAEEFADGIGYQEVVENVEQGQEQTEDAGEGRATRPKAEPEAIRPEPPSRTTAEPATEPSGPGVSEERGERSVGEKFWGEVTRFGREDLLKTTILGDQADRISRITWNNLSQNDRKTINEAVPEFEIGGVKLYAPEPEPELELPDGWSLKRVVNKRTLMAPNGEEVYRFSDTDDLAFRKNRIDREIREWNRTQSEAQAGTEEQEKLARKRAKKQYNEDTINGVTGWMNPEQQQRLRDALYKRALVAIVGVEPVNDAAEEVRLAMNQRSEDSESARAYKKATGKSGLTEEETITEDEMLDIILAFTENPRGLAIARSLKERHEYADRLGVERLPWPGDDVLSERLIAAAEKARETPTEEGNIEVVLSASYASGMGAAADWDAAIESGQPFGVDIGILSDARFDQIAEVVANGQRVFIDSGAFRLFRESEKKVRESGQIDFLGQQIKAIDDAQVMLQYQALSDNVHDLDVGDPYALALVMPDVVGQPELTLDLLLKHKGAIAELAASGHDIIIPIQSDAKMPAKKFAYRVMDLMGAIARTSGNAPFSWRWGIPSNAKAMSDEALTDFVNEIEPSLLHILGAVNQKKLQPRLDAIKAGQGGMFEIDVSADGNLIRSSTDELMGLRGEERSARLAEIVTAKVGAQQDVTATEFAGPTQEEIDAAADEAATSAENDLPQPTQAQKEAGAEGNYKLGAPVTLYGVTWRVENPAGSYRFKFDEKAWTELAEGTEAGRTRANMLSVLVDLRNGHIAEAFARARKNRRAAARKILSESWYNKMPAHYARAVGPEFEAADGDKLDAFIGLNAENQNLDVFVVDLQRFDGKGFDESKVLIGFNARGSAWNTLRASYDAGIIDKLVPGGVESVVRFTPEQFRDWVSNESNLKRPVSDIVAERGKPDELRKPERTETPKPGGTQPEVLPGAKGERKAGRLRQPPGTSGAKGAEQPTSEGLYGTGGVGSGQVGLFDADGGVAADFGRDRRPERLDAQDTERNGRNTESRSARVRGSRAGSNFVIPSNFLGKTGAKTRAKQNIAAIEVVKSLPTDLNNLTGIQKYRQPTAEEQDILVKYVGWGGIPQIFDPRQEKWSKEYAQLKELLTNEEWEAARRSTQDAHYTSETVVRAMYDGLARLGFTGGKLLEPSVGIGHFFGMMPESLRSSVQATGVELDPLTASIAQALYPKNSIHNRGFQDFAVTDNFYDVVIGNPPFGDQKLFDPERRHLNKFSIHNYFIGKAIEITRPGGVVAVVVSRYFMDSINTASRRHIATQAEFLGALRLPRTAFMDNANTEVVTDIVFLQKLEQPSNVAVGTWWQEPARIKLSRVSRAAKEDPRAEAGEEEVRISKYFDENPAQIMGELAMTGTMYRENELTVDPVTTTPGYTSLAEWLSHGIESLPENVITDRAEEHQAEVEAATTQELSGSEEEIIKERVQVHGYFKLGVPGTGPTTIYQRIPDQAGELKFIKVEDISKSPTKSKRMAALIDLRDHVRKQLRLELADDPGMITNRQALNSGYDRFVKKFGYLHQTGNKRVFEGDPSYPLLLSLEVDFDRGISTTVARKQGVQPKKPSAKKAGIFTRRVLIPHHSVNKVTNAKDALSASLSERGRIDPEYMQRIYAKPFDEAMAELGDDVYEHHDGSGWTVASEYLSGNVKNKLKAATTAAESNSAIERNVVALNKVIPADLDPVDISIAPTSIWVPEKYIADFAHHLLGEGATVEVTAVPAQGKFVAKLKGANNVIESSTWGTARMYASDIFGRYLRGTPIKVYDKDADGKSILNQEATIAATEKLESIKREFQDWIWTEAERRTDIASIYNDTFNTNVERTFDGSHLGINEMGEEQPLPGANPEIELLPHQKDAVWRGIQTGKVLFDHVVGAGKTYVAISVMMERKRLGLVNKPTYTVPNHLVGQWAADFTRLYPGANVLAATKKDFQKANRRKFMGKIATGNWDGVIIAHSSFKFVGMPLESLRRFIDEQVADLTASQDAVKAGNGDKRSIKQMEKQKEKLENKYKEQVEGQKKDQVLTFDELGVDGLVVDEAHMFKNLMYSTSMGRNVAGLGATEGSQRSMDLFIKLRYVLENNNDQNGMFLTGTPISNSIAEMYTMQRYMGWDDLRARGLVHFDAWASTYADVVGDWEIKASGQGYQFKERFRYFQNLSELMKMYREFADVVTQDDLKAMRKRQGLPSLTPPIKGGGPVNVVVDRSADQAAYMDDIIRRVDNLKNVDPDVDNMLKITSDARKSALDMRLISPEYADNPDSKVHDSANRIKEIYDRYNKVKGTQLVFIDLSTPKGRQTQEQRRIAQLIERAEQDDETALEALSKLTPDEIDAAHAKFDVYNDLKGTLIESGIPDAEIAFIHDANTEIRKEELFEKVRQGVIRVLLGSTAKMGAGMNVQNRLVAEHNLDAPWRPSDLEQREGRIIRQGNLLYEGDDIRGIKPWPDFEVEIYRYATEMTYDSRMWQTIENKALFIQQVRTAGLLDRRVEDVGGEAANAAAMKAAASGNPLIEEEIKLRTDIKKLETIEREYSRKTHRLEELVNGEADIAKNLAEDIRLAEVDLAQRIAVKKDEFAGIRIRETSFGKKKAGGQAAALELMKFIRSGRDSTGDVGVYRGFPFFFVKALGGFAVGLNANARNYTSNYQTKRFGDTVALSGGRSTAVSQDDKIDPNGLLQRLDNMIASMEDRPEWLRDQAELDRAEVESAKKELGKPFDKREELDTKRTRHQAILKELSKTEEDKRKEEQAELNVDTMLGVRGGGLGVKIISEHTKKIVGNWKNLPTGVVVTTRQHLSKVPQHIVTGLEIKDPNGNANGMYARDINVVFLFADNLSSLHEVERVLIHEIKGHFGARTFFGENYRVVADYMVKVFPEIAAAEAKRLRADMRVLAHRNRVGDEIIARITERIEDGSATSKMRRAWDRFYSLLLKALRALGFTHYTPNRAEARNLIRAAASYVERGAPKTVPKGKGEDLMVAYHGSPHRFEKFDFKKIGTGEGFQAFSYGLYFAQIKKIGQFYQNGITGAPEITVDGKKVVPSLDHISVYRAAAEGQLDEYIDANRKWVDSKGKDTLPDSGTGFTAAQRIAAAEALKGKDVQYTELKGVLYEVEIDDGAVAKMLDWDAKVPQNTRDKLAPHAADIPYLKSALANPVTTGGGLYGALHVALNKDTTGQAASEWLLNLGIPGVKYFDSLSRARAFTGGGLIQPLLRAIKRKDSRNIVVFDDSIIKMKTMKVDNKLVYFVSDPANNTDLSIRRADAADKRGRLIRAIGKTPAQPIDRIFRKMFTMFGSIDDRGVFHISPRATVFASNAIDHGRAMMNAKHFEWLRHIGGVAHARLNEEYQIDDRWKNTVAAAKAGLIDRYGQSKQYIEREYKYQADKRMLEGEVKKIVDTFTEQGLSAEELGLMQLMMTGQEVGPEHLQKLTGPIINAIDQMGAEYVELGILQAKDFERWKGKYLARAYKSHEYNKSSLTRMTEGVLNARRKRIHGSQFIRRGLVWKKGDLTMKRLLRDVPESWWQRKKQKGKADPALMGNKFVILQKVSQVGGGTFDLPGMDPRKVEQHVLNTVFWPVGLKIPNKWAGWDNRGIFEVTDTNRDKVELWRDWTPEERANMGEIVNAKYTIVKTYMQAAHDLASGRFFLDIAKNPDWASKTDPVGDSPNASESRRKVYMGAEWVKVPETVVPGTKTARYGALSGLYIRKEIWLDIHETQAMQKAGWWKSILTFWKLNKTARNPVVHMNNIMANIMLMDMVDVRVRDLMQGIRSYIDQDEHFLDARNHGAFGVDMVTQELKREILDPIIRELEREQAQDAPEGLWGVMGRIWMKVRELDDKLIHTYRLEDEVFRMATYMREVRLGTPPAEAAASAREQFLNYDIRAPWVNALRQTVLPFIAYTYRAVPIVAKSMRDRPWKLVKYVTLAYMMNSLSYIISGGDEDEERATLRPEESGRTWIRVKRMLRTPFSDRYGNPIFLDIRRWIPAGDVFDLNQGSSAIPIPAPIQFGGPLMMAAELFLNKQGFTGDEIINELTDSPGEQAAAIGDWLWKSWAPSAPWIPGSWYFTKIKDAATGNLDPLMREYSVPLAISSSIGIKLKAHDVELNRRYQLMYLDMIDRALNAEMSAYTRDLSRRRITREVFDRERANIIRKIGRVADRRRELVPGAAAN